VAEPSADARIRDLKRRLELDPASRLFVSLAEEYRKAGRVGDALITLQKGLRNHPGYISAQVALGRAFLETGNISEAIATFTKVLTADPGNLVSAKSLADIYLSRGESVEALKKYKLYRALSGDRKVADIVERLEKEIASPAPRPSQAAGPAPLPAPPTFQDAPEGGRRSRAVEIPQSPSGPVPRREDVLDAKSIKWEESTGGKRKVEQAPAVSLSERPTDRLEPAAAGPGPVTVPAEGQAGPAEAQGRALADLYFAQGHYAEALRICDELVVTNPFDEDLKRLRRDAEARLLPAGVTPGATAAAPGLQRRLAKIRALKEWLSVVQAG
jgi:tetratricopeptide (TPR) repeat protein